MPQGMGGGPDSSGPDGGPSTGVGGGRTEGRSGGRTKRRRTLLDWIDPRDADGIRHYVEGREGPTYGDEQITREERRRRTAEIKAAEEKYAKIDAQRAKIKPIADPEEGKSARRRRAAQRKKKGRAGTTTLSQGSYLSQGNQTLG